MCVCVDHLVTHGLTKSDIKFYSIYAWKNNLFNEKIIV